MIWIEENEELLCQQSCYVKSPKQLCSCLFAVHPDSFKWDNSKLGRWTVDWTIDLTMYQTLLSPLAYISLSWLSPRACTVHVQHTKQALPCTQATCGKYPYYIVHITLLGGIELGLG